MESPFGPVLADIFIANIEKTKLKGSIYKMVYYARYVDDTFIICNNLQQAKHLPNLYKDAHKT